MCDDLNVCQTLGRRNTFYWCLCSGEYQVYREINGTKSFSFSCQIYSDCQDLIFSQPNGTPLGASGDGNVPNDSLGALLKTKDKSRPLASYLAAIAVSEGSIQFENLGRGPNRGVRLYPVLEETTHSITDNRDGANLQANRDENTSDEASTSESVAHELRNLADRVESSRYIDRKKFELNLSDLTLDYIPSLISDIRIWEDTATESRFIYKFTVDSDDLATQLHDCMSNAKTAKENTRKYSRVNHHSANSRCLYVGSSKSVTTRMKQHLGYSHPSIFSLHIKHWPSLPNAALKIEIVKYPANIGQDVLQAIEDGIWQLSRPLFGKQGAK